MTGVYDKYDDKTMNIKIQSNKKYNYHIKKEN